MTENWHISPSPVITITGYNFTRVRAGALCEAGVYLTALQLEGLPQSPASPAAAPEG